MLKSFLYNVTELSGTYTLADREAECIKYIRNTTGNKKVLVSLLFDVISFEKFYFSESEVEYVYH